MLTSVPVRTPAGSEIAEPPTSERVAMEMGEPSGAVTPAESETPSTTSTSTRKGRERLKKSASATKESSKDRYEAIGKVYAWTITW